MIEKAAASRYDVLADMRDQKIKSLVQKTVKETLRAELAHARGQALPLVSKKEMADITKRYKKPTGRIARVVRVKWTGK